MYNERVFLCKILLTAYLISKFKETSPASLWISLFHTFTTIAHISRPFDLSPTGMPLYLCDTWRTWSSQYFYLHELMYSDTTPSTFLENIIGINISPCWNRQKAFINVNITSDKRHHKKFQSICYFFRWWRRSYSNVLQAWGKCIDFL
jgi:hypothetical protein